MGYQQLPLDGHADPFGVTTLGVLVEQATESYSAALQGRNIQLEIDHWDVDCRVPIRPFQATISILIEEALNVMPRGGRLSFSTIDSGAQVELVVSRTGQKKLEEDGLVPRAQEQKQLRFQQVIREVQQALIPVGGNVETWTSDSGDTTSVLIFPVRRKDRFAQ